LPSSGDRACHSNDTTDTENVSEQPNGFRHPLFSEGNRSDEHARLPNAACAGSCMPWSLRVQRGVESGSAVPRLQQNAKSFRRDEIENLQIGVRSASERKVCRGRKGLSQNHQTKIRSNEPNHVAAVIERSFVPIEASRYDAAGAEIEQALALDANYADAHANRGLLHMKLKRNDDAATGEISNRTVPR